MNVLKLMLIAGLITVSAIAGSFLFSQPASAAVSVSNSEVQDYGGAVNYINWWCSNANLPNAVAVYPSNASFNTDTGRLDYDLNLVWKSCGRQETRAFAITGYSAEGLSGLQTCASAGNYHNGWDSTHDCIKYDRSDGGVMTGQSTLQCPQGKNYACVNGGSDPNGYFRRVVERQEFQPSGNFNTSTQRMYGQVPNWDAVKGASGSHSFYRGQAVCTYAKINNQGETRANSQCVSLRIDASWTRYNYDLTPAITNPSKDGIVTQSDSGTYNVTGLVTNSGSTSSRSTEWRLTQIIYPTNVALGSIPRKAVGESGQDPCDYYRNGNPTRPCVLIGNGDSTYTTSGGSEQSDTSIGGQPVGTKICFGLSVRPYSHTASEWRHSALKCLVVGKKPKVQVWGGDLIVGRQGVTSNVSTSTTSTKRSANEVDAPAAAFSGLYRTGVRNDNVTPLSANAPDTHWLIDRVYRPSGYGGDTCQWMVTGASSLSTALTKIPTKSSSTPLPARVVSQSGGSAGLYVGSGNGLDVVGNAVIESVRLADGSRPWFRTSSTARWIGQNQYAQNYSSTSCNEPTFNEPTNINKSNIYVFKLKDGFTIDRNYGILLDTVRLRLGGGFDNVVTFYVNGKQVGSPQNPGWSPGATATSEAQGNVFKYGKNELEIHIQSTYSHTGILIDDFTIQAKAIASEDKTYGSWGEYAGMSTGIVTGFGSGSAYAGGTTIEDFCKRSLLTFANHTSPTNTCAPGAIGSFTARSTSPASGISNRFVPNSGAISGTKTLQELLPSSSESAAGVRGKVYSGSGSTIRLRSGTDIPKGKYVVINAPTSTVIIENNIRYTGDGLGSVNDIPQVVIIAQNIVISDGVEQVDSWLIATGTGTNGYIKTCESVPLSGPTNSTLNSGSCDATLRVNGPVIANRLLMYRTAGAGSGIRSGDPAEVFNLRPDAYLWASNLQNGANKARTVQTVELPPRF